MYEVLVGKAEWAGEATLLFPSLSPGTSVQMRVETEALAKWRFALFRGRFATRWRHRLASAGPAQCHTGGIPLYCPVLPGFLMFVELRHTTVCRLFVDLDPPAGTVSKAGRNFAGFHLWPARYSISDLLLHVRRRCCSSCVAPALALLCTSPAKTSIRYG